MKRYLIIMSFCCALLCSCAAEGSSISKSEVMATKTETTATAQTTTTAAETTVTTTTAETTVTTEDDIFAEPEPISGGHEKIAEVDGNSYAKFSGKLTVGGKESSLADVVIQRENYTHRGDDTVEVQYYIPYDRLGELGARGLSKSGSVVNFSTDSAYVQITDGELIVTDNASGESDFGLCGNIEVNGVFYVGLKNLVPLFGGKVTEYTEDSSPYLICCDFEL